MWQITKVSINDDADLNVRLNLRKPISRRNTYIRPPTKPNAPEPPYGDPFRPSTTPPPEELEILE